MFKVLGRSAGSLVDISVEEKLLPADFVALRRQLTPLIEEHGKLRLLFDLRQLQEFEGEALWDDSSFRTHSVVERVALVVPEQHESRATEVFSLGASEVRSFEPDRAEDAWRWVAGTQAA